MDPKSLTNLFSYKSDRIKGYQLRDIQVVLVYQNLELIIWKIVLCLTEQNFGILSPKTLDKRHKYIEYMRIKTTEQKPLF